MGTAAVLHPITSSRKIADPGLLRAWMDSVVLLTNKNPRLIKTLHDELLYHMAFPLNAALYDKAFHCMHDLSDMIRQLMAGKNRRVQVQLSGTGMAYTLLNCSYSYTLASSLAMRFPGLLSISGSDATTEEVVSVFRLLLPAIEFEKITQRSLSLSGRIQAISGLRSPVAQLQWLMEVFQQSDSALSIKEILFQQLKLFLHWELREPEFSRSMLRIPFTKRYYQGSRESPVINPDRIRKEKLKMIRLSAGQQQQIALIMKTSLAYYYRETDPFTYADPDSISLFDMGRGLHIALVGMQAGQQLSLESYIGYMAFKNGIPVAYGGGWIWGHRCKIGLNIYPPFRKAESDWLFCQVLRLYHQHYHINHFIVRPYQFGKSNPEGIRSGAFWFYYKLGFIPVEDGLRVLAASEWEKISRDKKYRTPKSVLKQFTAGDMHIAMDKQSYPTYEANVLSAKISREINTRFDRSREKALHAAMILAKKCYSRPMLRTIHHLPSSVRQNFLLLTLCIPDIASWPESEKLQLVELFRLKASGNEREGMLRLQAQSRLWRSLETFIFRSH